MTGSKENPIQPQLHSEGQFFAFEEVANDDPKEQDEETVSPIVIDSRRSDSQSYSFQGSEHKQDHSAAFNSKYGQVVHAPRAGGNKKLQLFAEGNDSEDEAESPQSDGTPVEVVGSGHFFN